METIFSDGRSERSINKIKEALFSQEYVRCMNMTLIICGGYICSDYIRGSVRSTGGQFPRNVYYTTNIL